MTLPLLIVVPVTLAEANEHVTRLHRHHKRVVSHKFSMGCMYDGKLAGVVIAGRPVSRVLDDKFTIEITRLCSDGTPFVCSKLYAAARKVAFAMGYKKVITYTLASERGSSLQACGFEPVAKTKGGTWSCPSRPRINKHPTECKTRWEATV